MTVNTQPVSEWSFTFHMQMWCFLQAQQNKNRLFISKGHIEGGKLFLCCVFSYASVFGMKTRENIYNNDKMYVMTSLKGSYDAILKIIILCIWCNRIC